MIGAVGTQCPETLSIVALGATAIRGALGRSEAVSRLRGDIIDLGDGAQFLATVHPSSLLRLKYESDKRDAWRGFLADLRKIARWIEKDARALD